MQFRRVANSGCNFVNCFLGEAPSRSIALPFYTSLCLAADVEQDIVAHPTSFGVVVAGESVAGKLSLRVRQLDVR